MKEAETLETETLMLSWVTSEIPHWNTIEIQIVAFCQKSSPIHPQLYITNDSFLQPHDLYDWY